LHIQLESLERSRHGRVAALTFAIKAQAVPKDDSLPAQKPQIVGEGRGGWSRGSWDSAVSAGPGGQRPSRERLEKGFTTPKVKNCTLSDRSFPDDALVLASLAKH